MGWKQNNFANCEYKKRLEQVRDKIVEVRDAYVQEEIKKLEHLKDTIEKANAHRAAQKKASE